MQIGVAIPCYAGHMSKLSLLLDSIENQTVLPNKVVVSCSSTEEFKINKKYSFPLFVILSLDKKNAAENRNIASAQLLSDMDYITFFDADDIMHPQRIEVLCKVINENQSDIVLHNFYYDTELSKPEDLPKIDNVEIRNNMLIPAWSGCVTHIHGYNDSIDRIHHSQVTIKKELFYKVQFPEDKELHRREDSVFCNRILHLEGIKNTYIVNKLSYYNPSGTIF